MIGYWHTGTLKWIKGDMPVYNAFKGAPLTMEGFKPNIVEINTSEFTNYSNEEIGAFIVSTLIPAISDTNGKLIINKD